MRSERLFSFLQSRIKRDVVEDACLINFDHVESKNLGPSAFWPGRRTVLGTRFKRKLAFTLSLWGALRDIQKTAAKETTMYEIQ